MKPNTLKHLNKTLIRFAIFTLSGLFVSCNSDLTTYVDPFIGTMGGGNTFAGVCLPHGFVKLGPDCPYPSGAAGYKQDKDVVGFSHLHISGMGGPVYGNIQLIPTTGEIESLHHISPKVNEVATVGYYKTGLKKYNTLAELTCTAHAGFHKYTFPKSKNSHVLIDVGATLYGNVNAGSWNTSVPVGGQVTIDPENSVVSGFGTYKGGRSTTEPWTVYFYAITDTKFNSCGTWNDSVLNPNQLTTSGNQIGAFLNFDTKESQEIKIKVGISMISVEKAKQNVENEIQNWDFESTVAQAKKSWNQELKKIEIDDASKKEKKVFYTALYHSLLMPSDWTGENPKFDYGHPYYEDFLCIWDMYRTVNPLLTLISTHENIDMLNTLLDIYKTNGWLPDAHSALQYEHVQIGTNADNLFADAFVKGLKGIDYEQAYEAVKKDATDTLNYEFDGTLLGGRKGLGSYLKYHYVPVDGIDYWRKISVSRTLDYIYNDFCAYQMAKGLNKKEDMELFAERFGWYKNLWDDSLKLMRARNKDGSWFKPFNPLDAQTGPVFYEGTAYTWTYSVPHDVDGLIDLFGGKQAFTDSLTRAVSNHYEAYNEPAMLQIYLFLWAQRPDLTQKYIRKALAENFTDAPNGLPGNDDGGTTSAWYVWSRMGIFPVAGQNLYLIGSPSFKESVIHLENGKDFIIKAKNASESNIYIQSAKWNGKEYNKPFFTHDDIIKGGVLEFEMGNIPSKWGSESDPA